MEHWTGGLIFHGLLLSSPCLTKSLDSSPVRDGATASRMAGRGQRLAARRGQRDVDTPFPPCLEAATPSHATQGLRPTFELSSIIFEIPLRRQWLVRAPDARRAGLGLRGCGSGSFAASKRLPVR